MGEHWKWREDVLKRVASPDVAISTAALVEVTYNEPDRSVVESVLRKCLTGQVDPQLHSLAVICIGHVGRIHRAVSGDLVEVLKSLLDDATLGGRAEDALGDISSFVPDIKLDWLPDVDLEDEDLDVKGRQV